MFGKLNSETDNETLYKLIRCVSGILLFDFRDISSSCSSHHFAKGSISEFLQPVGIRDSLVIPPGTRCQITKEDTVPFILVDEF